VDAEAIAAFERVAREAGKFDILVNNVWGGYERMVEDGTFTWTKPFWEQGLWRWDAMFGAGVRAHYHAKRTHYPKSRRLWRVRCLWPVPERFLNATRPGKIYRRNGA